MPSPADSIVDVTRLKRDSLFTVDFAGFSFHVANHGACGSAAIIMKMKKMIRMPVERKHYNVRPRSVLCR